MSVKNQFVFYYPQNEEKVIIEGEPAFQIARVLRLNPGDAILLLNGRGRQSRFILDSVSPKEVRATLAAVEEKPAPLPLILAFGLLKNDKTEWVIQKGTELGVTRFLIFEADHSVARLKDGGERKLARYQKIAQEAHEQSCGFFLPEIKTCKNLSQTLEEFSGLWLAAESTVLTGLKPFESCLKEKGAGILIGLRGDFLFLN